MNPEDIKAQLKVIKSFIDIIQIIINKDNIDIELLKTMVDKLNRTTDCYIEIL